MTTKEELDRVVGWFRARLPEEWTPSAAEIVVDREEITVLLGLPESGFADGDGAEVRAEGRRPAAAAFREESGNGGWTSPTRPGAASAARSPGARSSGTPAPTARASTASCGPTSRRR